MSKEISLSSWQEFVETFHSIIRQGQESSTGFYSVQPSIFRGQADASWPLTTSLERIVTDELSLPTYFGMIKDIQSEIETFTNTKWDIPSKDSYRNWVKSRGSLHNVPAIDYKAYLRHHGYPSPLLDWSNSPFVAAYFAFREISNRAKYVAIYTYTDSADGVFLSSAPEVVFKLRNRPRTTRRHYLQQSVYTICCRKQENDIYYASHEKFFLRPNDNYPEIRKYILPASERETALMSLETYNINAYSLMGSDESLLETLFLRRYALMEAIKARYPGYEGSDWNIHF